MDCQNGPKGAAAGTMEALHHGRGPGRENGKVCESYTEFLQYDEENEVFYFNFETGESADTSASWLFSTPKQGLGSPV